MLNKTHTFHLFINIYFIIVKVGHIWYKLGSQVTFFLLFKKKFILVDFNLPDWDLFKDIAFHLHVSLYLWYSD